MRNLDTQFTSALPEKWQNDVLRYSFVWEDFMCLNGAIEQNHTNPDRILSIASSGDNALALLINKPKKVIAIDINFSQIAFTSLKKVAVQQLNHKEFMDFFWSKNEGHNLKLYSKIQNYLPDDVQKYFKVHKELFAGHLSHSGRLDVYFEKFRSNILPLLWNSEELSRMVDTPHLKEQLACLSSANPEKIKKLCSDFFSKKSLSQEGRSTEQFLHTPKDIPKEHFFLNFLSEMKKSVISENPYTYCFFTGQPFSKRGAHPLFREETFNQMKENIEALEIVHQDVESYLLENRDKFDFMNLSDIFEYTSEEHTQKLFEHIYQNLQPGGSVAYWTLLTDRKPVIKSLLQKKVPRDRTGFYSNFYCYQNCNSL